MTQITLKLYSKLESPTMQVAPYDGQNLSPIEAYKLILFRNLFRPFSCFVLSKFIIYKIINNFRVDVYIKLVFFATL